MGRFGREKYCREKQYQEAGKGQGKTETIRKIRKLRRGCQHCGHFGHLYNEIF